MAHKWRHDPQYSHGELVPLFAVVLLWLRREHLAKVGWQFSWYGPVLLLVSAFLRVASAYLYFDWLDGASFILCLAGLFALLGGLPALRWAGPAVGFLFFMVPLPYRLETNLSGPLRELATSWSTFVLQLIGVPALSEGNTIVLGQGGSIGVEEACSGLSMLLTFIALATAVAIVVERSSLERIIILVSAVPVALCANVLRITATALAHEWVNPQFMMPFALALLGLELWIMSRLFVRQTATAPIAVSPARPTTPALTVPGKKAKADKNTSERVYFPGLRRR
jgi:exosortase